MIDDMKVGCQRRRQIKTGRQLFVLCVGKEKEVSRASLGGALPYSKVQKGNKLASSAGTSRRRSKKKQSLLHIL